MAGECACVYLEQIYDNLYVNKLSITHTCNLLRWLLLVHCICSFTCMFLQPLLMISKKTPCENTLWLSSYGHLTHYYAWPSTWLCTVLYMHTKGTWNLKWLWANGAFVLTWNCLGHLLGHQMTHAHHMASPTRAFSNMPLPVFVQGSYLII